MDNLEGYSSFKGLPKDYLILELRMTFNKELYEKNVISFDVYNKMQKFLISKMDRIVFENNI